ncbi:MAG: response regulator [Elusimicrobia bacterium]|nr:response regulator [Elusimicrobiota bacterium]
MARIMVVDDDKAALGVVRETLEADRHTVSAYADPAAALKSLAKEGAALPELLILDVMMPGIDGVEFHRRLQQDARTRALKVLVLTAHQRFEPRFVGAAGVKGFLTRPFAVEVLRKTVSAILAGA